jgi:hypothetical protein
MARGPVIYLLIALVLFACDWSTPPIQAPLFTSVPPSQTPAILSPTPIILTSTANPSGTVGTTTATADETLTAVETSTPTEAEVLTPTATPTPTPGLATLVTVILGCNTSLDLTHQMGEVTNAYVVVRNVGSAEAANVCATLSASDESREHPDKTKCIPALPPAYQVALKLTVDTGYKEDTAIKVEVRADGGITAEIEMQSCRSAGMPGSQIGEPGVVQPIP